MRRKINYWGLQKGTPSLNYCGPVLSRVSRRAKRENIMFDGWYCLRITNTIFDIFHRKRVHLQTLKFVPTYFICFNNFIGSGLIAGNSVKNTFSILKGQFLLLYPWLNAGSRLEFCGMLKASILGSVVFRKHGIFSLSYICSLDFIDDLLDVW